MALTNAIKEVNAVPSGLAVTLEDEASLQAALGMKVEIVKALDSEALVEREQKWNIFVVPDTPRTGVLTYPEEMSAKQQGRRDPMMTMKPYLEPPEFGSACGRVKSKN